MKLDKKLVQKIIVILAAAAICFGGGIMVASRPSSAPKITDDLISTRIEEINELAVMEYRYTKVGKYENRLDFYGWEVPLTLKRFIISYDGTIKAGIDLGKAKVKVKGNSVNVTLPKAEILAHDIDLESITVFDETKNIFNPIQITDYVDFSKDQKKVAESEATNKGLMNEAQNRACDVVRQWVVSMYGNAEEGGPEVTVTVEE